MTDKDKNKKRTHEEMEDFVDLSVAQLGNSFKSKADFINYWGSMLQVSASACKANRLFLNSGILLLSAR